MDGLAADGIFNNKMFRLEQRSCNLPNAVRPVFRTVVSVPDRLARIAGSGKAAGASRMKRRGALESSVAEPLLSAPLCDQGFARERCNFFFREPALLQEGRGMFARRRHLASG